MWETTRRRLLPLLEWALNEGSAGLSYICEVCEARPELLAGQEREIAGALARLAEWDAAALHRDAERFARVYSPVGILPPDQYLAQVVQLTRGCSFNTCTYCTFYRDIPFHIRTPEEMQQHLVDVDAFLGRGTYLRRSLFLGDANALVSPMPKLEALLQLVREHYGDRIDRFDGMHAFLDGFSGARKSAEEFTRLRELGLQQVSVGLESGHDPLLRWLQKPGTADEAGQAIQSMKEAGLQVSLIVLLGAGGTTFKEGHQRDTATLLSALPLGKQDIVYFSEFVDQPGAPYGVVARQDGVEPLDAEGMVQQRTAIAGGIPPHAEGGPRTAVYDIREFTY